MSRLFEPFIKIKAVRDKWIRPDSGDNNGDPPMNKFTNWIKEHKIYFSIWILIAYIAIWVSISLKIDISGKIDYKIEYKQPWVVENILSNKK